MGWMNKFRRRDAGAAPVEPPRRNLSANGPEQSPEQIAKIRAQMEQELDAQRNARGSE